MFTFTSITIPNLTNKVQKVDGHAFRHGSDADIFLGNYQKGDRVASTPVVIKVVRNIFDEADAKRLNEKLVREARVWCLLNHQNIVPFLGISYDLGQHDQPCLISPFYENGNAIEHLRNNPNANRESLLCQVAAGLAYLHGQKPPIVHGDMKGSNILINDRGKACITDFGLSRILETAGFTTKNLKGTTRYIALELITHDSHDIAPRLTIETDVWAFGMTGLEILTSQLPFANLRSDGEVVRHVMKGGTPDRKAQGMQGEEFAGHWELMKSCWHQDPRKRIPMRVMHEQLVSHQATSSSTSVSVCCMQ
ncbi:kinase-like domain-containing protein [Hygrophoropsis aurantiaca]|uniref:Kinase-like domain-containing protein n=1 Tax=Hygrophoropsis aurantiaca TaxID=72124 RepID=A0ACB8A7A8_9AGAM|nr:kinase-like domain-containing protein [Hygrophoropsis aurantiaca]